MSKIVLITGVSAGIGQACAQLFKSKKYKVIGIDCNPAAANCPVDEFTKVDLSKIDELESFHAAFIVKYGKLDVLINNAGVHLFKSVEETTIAEYDFVQAVNCRAPFILSKLFLPLLKKSQGSIVNLSSVNAISTTANRSAYASSKAGVLSLTRSLALEFAPFKIRVNAVLPGPIHTQMMREHVKNYTPAGDNKEKIDQFVADFGKTALLGRMGEPMDVAKAIYYFADNNQSSFVTGQSVTVDGGCLAQYSLSA